jgi:hypothetical protein
MAQQALEPGIHTIEIVLAFIGIRQLCMDPLQLWEIIRDPSQGVSDMLPETINHVHIMIGVGWPLYGNLEDCRHCPLCQVNSSGMMSVVQTQCVISIMSQA